MHGHSAESVSPTERTISGAGAADKRGVASGAASEPVGVPDVTAIDDETRKPPVARRPYTPTAAEVEAHLPLHLEYRSWCPHCVGGRGVATQHRASHGESDEMGITVSLDYCFMTAEDTEEDMRAI